MNCVHQTLIPMRLPYQIPEIRNKIIGKLKVHVECAVPEVPQVLDEKKFRIHHVLRIYVLNNTVHSPL